ncbi:platelet glycoprotein Ib alpha chain-like isoform X2 [Salvelinus alpinus]|uniref:platelet glycoprotein Ib alpha chain-like isoform X2 n=1 Tax=Salvelinus alpinus TaxID=8036 RepID=UPI0039FBCD39
MLTSANWKLLPACLSHFLNMFYFAVAINTHTTTLQPSNPPPIAAQELSDTVAPQETSYTLILNQVEPPISPTIQETSYTPVLNQVEPLISPTTQETSYTPVLNQVEPPISPTTQETSYTPVLNQVEPLISPTTQETSYTPVLNQVEPPISPTTQETSYTPILNQVEPPISPTTQETSYTPILNQVEPPIFPTTQETSFTRIPNQVKPPITPTTQETSYTHTKPKKTGRKSCHLVTLKKPSKSMSMTVNSIPSNPIQPHPTPFYPIQPHPTPSNPDQGRRNMTTAKECPVHPGQTIFPILKILANRTSKEGQEQKVRWKPCSGCGKKWDDDWIKAEDRVSPV